MAVAGSTDVEDGLIFYYFAPEVLDRFAVVWWGSAACNQTALLSLESFVCFWHQRHQDTVLKVRKHFQSALGIFYLKCMDWYGMASACAAGSVFAVLIWWTRSTWCCRIHQCCMALYYLPQVYPELPKSFKASLRVIWVQLSAASPRCHWKPPPFRFLVLTASSPQWKIWAYLP